MGDSIIDCGGGDFYTPEMPSKLGNEPEVAVPERCYQQCGKLRNRLGNLAINYVDDVHYDAEDWSRALVCDKKSGSVFTCNALELHMLTTPDGVLTTTISFSREHYGKKIITQVELLHEASQANGRVTLTDAVRRTKK